MIDYEDLINKLRNEWTGNREEVAKAIETLLAENIILRKQLEEYREFDSFLYAHGFFQTNGVQL